MTVQYFKVFLILIVAAGIWACSVPLVVTVDIPDSRIPLNTGVRDASFLTNMEKEVIVELNAIRTNPRQYAEFLKSLRGSPQWSEGLEETILFVEKKEPLPAFRTSKGLSLAARNLVNDRGPEGLTGHTDKDGKSTLERMSCCGQPGGKFGEYLGYGYLEGAALVAKMAIDEGAAGKEGEKYIFERDFLVVGVACGPHKSYRTMCVVDFAGSYRE
ncbi:MAG TPA: hypothetical protein PKM17_03700 [Syntrophorhabdus sp.]|nr:hypothetical protein [Syntrophorhabdus sp.]